LLLQVANDLGRRATSSNRGGCCTNEKDEEQELGNTHGVGR